MTCLDRLPPPQLPPVVMPKKSPTEIEICDRFITPAIVRAGWDQHTQIRREFTFTAGQVIVRGKMAKRGERKRADYILLHGSNIPRLPTTRA